MTNGDQACSRPQTLPLTGAAAHTLVECSEDRVGAALPGGFGVRLPRCRLIDPPQIRPGVSVFTADEQPPPGGWIGVDDGEVVLRGRPPYEQTLPLALRVAGLVTDAAPSPGLLDWFATRPDQRLVFDGTPRRGLWRLFRDGDPRSWRFLEVTGVLADALPETSEALDRRRHDTTQLDSAGNLRWPLVERLVQPDDDTRLAAEYKRLDHPERVLLAAIGP